MADRNDDGLAKLNSRADGVQNIIDSLLEELKSARKVDSSRGKQTDVYHKVAGSAFKIPGLKLSCLPKPDEFLLNPLGHIDRIFELLASVSARGATLRTDCARRPERNEKLEIELDSNCSVQNSGKGYQHPYQNHGLSQSTFGNPRQIRISNTSVSSNSSQIHLANLVSYSPTNQSALSQQHRQIEVSTNSRAGHANISADCPPSFQQSSSTTDSTTRGQKLTGTVAFQEGVVDHQGVRHHRPPMLPVVSHSHTAEGSSPAEAPAYPLKSSSSLSSFQKLESKVVSSLQQPQVKQLPMPQIKTKSLDEYARSCIQSSDDYEFRFSNDLPANRLMSSVNPAPKKSGCIKLRDSENSSTPVASKENMLSGYQSSEELSDSVEEAETNSKDTEDLLRSYHSAYSESERPEILVGAENSREETPAANTFADLKVDLLTTDLPENHKSRLSDVSIRLLEEVDSRISAEMRLSSVKQTTTKPQSPFSCSEYFKLKKHGVPAINDDCKENISLGNRMSAEQHSGYGQKQQAVQQPKFKEKLLLENIYGGPSCGNEDSEIMIDENGDLYGITSRSYRGAHSGIQPLSQQAHPLHGDEKPAHHVLREIKRPNQTKQREDRQSPYCRTEIDDAGCSLKSSVMSSQYNMMLSAEMLKREYQKFGCHQESAKWSLERNFPVTEETTGSRGRKNSGPLPTSMPSSSKDTTPGVISGETEGWGSRSRCVSTDVGRQLSGSRAKNKQTGSLNCAPAGSSSQGMGGYYNSYRRNFRPGVPGTASNNTQFNTHSRDGKEKTSSKGCPAPRLKLWK